MKKLLLIDGHNLLFQMFYGMPNKIVGKNGKNVEGVVGFIGALLKIIKITSPTHVAAIFDGQHENSRVEANPEYKANRPDYSTLPEEENPFSQLPYIYAALDELKIKHFETVDCETDDVMAAYALHTGNDTEVVISSFDSDFFQLISDRVSVLRYRGDNTVICTPQYVENKFGISPSQYADFKSLVGDTADNIRGADKIGPKTAASLISEFGDVEAIIAGVDLISRCAVRESVRKSAERIRTNYRIIRLDGESPLPFELEELEHPCQTPRTREILEAVGVL